jgi:hypothetical protein
MVAANKEATLLSSHDLFNRCGVSISQMTTICSVCHNHNPVLSSFMINHRSCNKIPSIDHGNKYYRMIWVIRPVSYKKHDMLILGKHPGFWWGPCFSFFSFLCCIFALFSFCGVCLMLYISLDCPFLIAASAFSNIYLLHFKEKYHKNVCFI